MTFHAYNTLHRRKEPLEPIVPGKVGFYVCGPTVYDLIHLGNARPLVVFDVLFRLLRLEFGEGNVKYVRNITDIEDKINAAAKERSIAIAELTVTTTERFHQDAAALGCLEPSVEPRATGHIPEMIALIERLIERSHAYEADGHVLFDVPSYEPYGRLSGNSRDEIVAGARIDVAPYKKDAADFVLWKPSVDDQPGWESPWGFGRPGWHLECSAMSHKHLGADFDIHGGGRDLIFPHHENEVAQTCAADPDGGFARIWMHNGYLSVDGEKMSKSLGNFYTVRDLLEEWPGEALRFALLSAQYRQPLDFTFDALKQAKASLDRFYNALGQAKDPQPGEVPQPVLDALNDDLNTPLAISTMHTIADAVFKGEAGAGAALRGAGSVLGLIQGYSKDWFQSGDDDETDEIEGLIAERIAARKDKDFARADQIRDDLKARGIELMDGPEGTSWKRV
ncbi:MAG: cysteine--tRNA ligase [Rhodospirillaceae bacterium]|nr:cysteine--tRNA ligase [Rhodospirillaceae bacterium]|tara:strand:- start:10810 stop:12162 length:1353 start_codon:yes stop_codon:yes gene_type:complete